MVRTTWLMIVALVVLMSSAFAEVFDEQNEQPLLIEPAEVTIEVEPPTAPAPVIPEIEIRTDREIFRRAPVIDGRIESGEWDVFYSVDAPVLKATTYVNWSGTSLYFGARADKPIDMMIMLDAKNDGWFHGADNYQIKALCLGVPEPVLEVLRYDSLTTRKPEPKLLSADAIGSAIMKTSAKDGEYIAEIELPGSLVQGLNLRAGNKIGLRFAIRPYDDEAAWLPSVTLGDVAECVLVENKAASLEPLKIQLHIGDTRVTHGEHVQARLTLRNEGLRRIDAATFIIGGEGGTGQYLNSEMIRLDGLEPNKRIRHSYSSRIPDTMPEGDWTLGAQVTVGDNRIAGTLASFEVAKPYGVTLDVGPQPMKIGADRHRFVLTVRNNTRGQAIGEAVLKLPDGWQVARSLHTRRFHIRMEDGVERFRFDIIIPENARTGTSTVSAEVTINRGEPIVVSEQVIVVGIQET